MISSYCYCYVFILSCLVLIVLLPLPFYSLLSCSPYFPCPTSPTSLVLFLPIAYCPPAYHLPLTAYCYQLISFTTQSAVPSPTTHHRQHSTTAAPRPTRPAQSARSSKAVCLPLAFNTATYKRFTLSSSRPLLSSVDDIYQHTGAGTIHPKHLISKKKDHQAGASVTPCGTMPARWPYSYCYQPITFG